MTTPGKCLVQGCGQDATYWVGSNEVDDYTYVCDDHVEAVRQAGDGHWKLPVSGRVQ